MDSLPTELSGKPSEPPGRPPNNARVYYSLNFCFGYKPLQVLSGSWGTGLSPSGKNFCLSTREEFYWHAVDSGPTCKRWSLEILCQTLPSTTIVGLMSFEEQETFRRENIHKKTNKKPELEEKTHMLYFFLLCYCCSFTKLCLTFFHPMNWSTPGFPVFHYLPEFAQIHVC